MWLVLLLGLLARSAWAVPTAHCETGLCLALTKGHSVGFLPDEAAPSSNQTKEGPGAVAGGEARMKASNTFLHVYLPTVPRTGIVHFRKLWEACTGVETQAAFQFEGSTPDLRTGAYTKGCGLSLTSADEQYEAECPAGVKKAVAVEPVLFKSNAPYEKDSAPQLLQQADVILLMVRNPVDAYNSMFAAKNKKYLESKNSEDLAWRVNLQDYLSTIWNVYLTTYDASSVPRVVMRYEDMYNNPVAFMQEVLVATGTARALGLTAADIQARVQKVEKATAMLKPTEVVGSGFKTLMKLSHDDRNTTMKYMDSIKVLLQVLGYHYYMEKDGPPVELEGIQAQHAARHIERTDGHNDLLGIDDRSEPVPANHNLGDFVIFLVVGVAIAGAIWVAADIYHKSLRRTVLPHTRNAPGGGMFGGLSSVSSKIQKAGESLSKLGGKTMTNADIESLKQRMQKRFQGKSAPQSSNASKIVEEARNTMSTQNESAGERLARLKALREKLANAQGK